jgi:two-component system, OmpR family, phosphate regulon sensor histidine kinase PhoR
VSRIQLKLAGAFAALAALLLGVTGLIAERELRARELARAELVLLEKARLTLEMARDLRFASEHGVELAAIARRAAAAAQARVTFISEDGRVVADSEVPVEALDRVENHADRSEVAAALAGRMGIATRTSHTVARSFMYLALPHASGTARDGVLRLAVDLDELGAAASALRGQLLWAGALGLLASVLLALLVSGLLIRPVQHIRSSVSALAAGTLSSRVQWHSADELGEIARAIDRLGEQLELRLREVTAEKEQLQTVLGSMEEGVLVLDPEGRIVLANRRLRELLGLTGEIAGRTPLEVLRNADLENALVQAGAGGESVFREIELGGRTRRVLGIRAAPLRGQAKGGVVAVFGDLTELRRLEVVRRDFVANASHELRTPLTAVQGFAETLASGKVPAADRPRYLEIILQHARRLGALVDDLLELSRIESGKLELLPSEVPLASVVDRALDSLSPLFEQRRIVARRGPIEPPMVRADPRALEQVLVNLLENAAKYTEPGGRVEVRAEPVGDRVRVSVEDTGIGIPESHLVRIFERFYRVDKARSRALGGTGLGLSIVRNLVEAMDGKVSVDSTPGKGSTFHFTLRKA